MPSRDARARRAQRRLGCALLLGARRSRSPRRRAAARATRGATPTPSCASSSSELGERLGGAYRVLVDANQHVDREAAARSGVGFYGKNTMLITRRHGSWVVLGTLVTDVRARADAAARHRLRRLPALHRRLPDRRARRAGRPRRDPCLSYWTQSPQAIPEDYRAELGDAGLRLRHLPGRLPVEPRRREAPRRPAARERRRATSILVDWLETDPTSCSRRLRPPVRAAKRPRFLRRNALIALGNTGGHEHIGCSSGTRTTSTLAGRSTRIGRAREARRVDGLG